MKLLILNSGSSTLKFEVIDMPTEKVFMKGIIEGIGLATCRQIVDGKSTPTKAATHEGAFERVMTLVEEFTIDAVGYRVVHGGEHYSSAVKIDAGVITKIDALKELAPLHNPRDLSIIKVARKMYSGIPHVAVFDTAYHETLPEASFRYAIPDSYYTKYKIRKYGFHGTSHKYIAGEAAHYLKKRTPTLISCHLGSGASVCAIKNGKSIATSMGFTPLQGLVMGTRAGDIDPAVISFIAEKERKSAVDVIAMLNKESGLYGLCGYSDMRVIHEKATKGDKRCQLAISIFVQRLVEYIGAYSALLGNKYDSLVFTGGIGEGAYYIREQVCNTLQIKLDTRKNIGARGKADVITQISNGTNPKVLVIPTHEELEIARETFSLTQHR